MGGITSRAKVNIALYQSISSNQYRFDGYVVVGANRLPGNILYAQPIDIKGVTGFVVIYVPSGFEIVASPSLNPVDRAPRKENANGYVISRGSYRLRYIDEGLEREAQVEVSRKIVSIGIDLNGDTITI